MTRFPITWLKIDRSFVKEVQSDPVNAALVRAIIEMAHTLGFKVIGEGVETEHEAAFLRQHGCEQAQGYFFARPMPLADLMALMRPAPPATAAAI